MIFRSIFLAAIMFGAAFAMPARSVAARDNRFPGPIAAEVERIVDGDTLAVRVQVWLGQELRVLVRIRGIDAPELRARCAEERRLAVRSADFLKTLLAGGRVILSNVSGGKYYGRVLADVAADSGAPLAAALLRAGLARPYAGRRRGSWCATQAQAR